MPIYDYLCEKCEIEFNVVKSIKEYDGKDECPACGNVGSRIYTRCNVYHTGASVKDAYKCPALGQIVKSDRHRKELASKLGVVEIGNDYKSADSLHKQFDTSREEKLKKSWDDV